MREIKNISIATPTGLFPVQAEVYGKWATHPTLSRSVLGDTLNYEYWTVTHVPTGYSVTGRTCYEPNLARSIAEHLDAAVDFNLSTVRNAPWKGGFVFSVIETALVRYEQETGSPWFIP